VAQELLLDVMALQLLRSKKMKAQGTWMVGLSVLALCGGARAATLGVVDTGGSELLLNVVNATDGSSASQDLGVQIAGVPVGGSFTLATPVLDFINAAGGLAYVQFSVIGGEAVNGTSAATYIHSSDNDDIGSLANAVRGTWFTTLQNYIANRLNASNATDTDPAVDAAYGPFAADATENYVVFGLDDWGTAGTCIANDNQCNLVAGTSAALLWQVSFANSFTGFAATTNLGTLASLDLQAGTLEIAPIPLPTTAWLLLPALAAVGTRVRRRRSHLIK
jgi:hypothetical protein